MKYIFIIALFFNYLTSCKNGSDYTNEQTFKTKDDIFIDSIIQLIDTSTNRTVVKKINNKVDTTFFFWKYPVFDSTQNKYLNAPCKTCDSVNDGMTYLIYKDKKAFDDQKLEHSIIPEPTLNKLAIFLKPVEFSEARFTPSKSYISKVTNISDARFDSFLIMENCKYDTKLYFKSCHFKDKVFIGNDYYTINNSITFRNCRSDSLIQFKIIYDSDLISYTSFSKDLIFETDSVTGKIDLSNTTFTDESKLVYARSTLPDTFDLSKMKLSGVIDLSESYPNIHNKKCEINLLNTDIKKIKLQYTNFHLYFPKNVYGKSQYKDAVSSTYESLLNNFKENGYEDSYQKLDIEYKDWQSKDNFWMWISNLWWKYGYEKWRVLIWTIAILLLFSFFNVIIYDKLFETYSIEQLEKSGYQFSKYFFLKVLELYWLSIMYTGFIFFKLSIDFDKIKIKRWGILLLVFFEYAIGLLCTGYLLNWVLSK